MPHSTLRLAVMVAVGCLAARGAAEDRSVDVSFDSQAVVARAVGPADGLLLRVTTPAGRVLEAAAGPNQELRIELAAEGAAAEEGDYLYEARSLPPAAPTGARPASRVRHGSFRVVAGQARPPATPAASAVRAPEPQPDETVLGDLRVTGSTCVGSANCPTLDFFGFPLVVDHAFPRVLLRDTVAPDADWSLNANLSSANFSLVDETANTVPFQVRAGAPNFSLFVDAAGRTGLGTSTPAGALHVAADAPSLRLQDTNDGRTWQLQLDDFFLSLRDVQAAHTPFWIRHGAPSNALTVNNNGDIGLGLQASAALHLRRSDGSARLLVEETESTVVGRNLLRLVNNGPPTFRFENSSNGSIWSFGNIVAGDRFFVSQAGVPSLSLTLDGAGNLTIAGALTQMSDRHAKRAIEPVDAEQVLERVAALPLAEWSYKAESARHLGPMAQDFAEAFGLGSDDTHLAPADVAGVALAAIQALVERQVALERRLAEIQNQLELAAPQR